MKKTVLFFFFSVMLFAYDATIEVVKKAMHIPKISIENSTPAGLVEKEIENKFIKLLIGDIKVTSHFNIDDTFLQGSFDDNTIDSSLIQKQIELLLKCKLEYDSKERLVASVKLINVKSSNQVFEKYYAVSKKERYPFLAHKITMDINDYIGAPAVKWMERLIVFSKYTGKGKSSIVISDYTLSFQKTIVQGGLNVFPKWANKKQTAFYYTSYNSLLPTLYKVDLYTGTKKKIISGSGMVVCSDVSKDGNKLLLTLAPNDQPDIYLYNLSTGTKDRITKYSGIDVSGSFVDNEERIVFISDRLGYPNVFAKGINSDNVEQMIYHGKNNSSCSTYGKYIVYSSRETNSAFGNNIFNLYLISTQTDYIRKLTATGKNLFPRFAGTDDTIIFIKHYKNESALGIIRLNANKSYLFPLKSGKIQSLDW